MFFGNKHKHKWESKKFPESLAETAVVSTYTELVPAIEEQSTTQARKLEQQRLIKELHEELETSGEKSLNKRKNLLQKELSPKILKAKRLAEIGFTQAEGVKDWYSVKNERESAQELVNTIEHYKISYPDYKFIKRENAIELFKKYGLACVPIQRYTGDIPDKNLQEIENFSKIAIRCEDRVRYYSWAGEEAKFIDNLFYEDEPAGLFIACPKDKVILTERERISENGFIINDDPIVLMPVKKGFLVVSKWGLEGEDPELINETHN